MPGAASGSTPSEEPRLPGRTAVLGAGTIGEAVLAGLLRAGVPPEHLVFCERYDSRADEVATRTGVARAATPSDALPGAVVVLVAVKPQDVADLLDAVAPALEPGQLVVSVAAGISTATLEAHLPDGTPVVRVMPNTAMVVDRSMSAVVAGTHATEEHLLDVEGLLRPVGRVVRVPEHQIDAVTALSGSGPAYVYLLAEAMVDAGVLLGLPRALATELTVQTAVGAATMLRDAGRTPAELREAVTSPGGTTAAALRALEQHRLRAAVSDAAEAAVRRAGELA